MIRKSFLYFSALSGLLRRSGPYPDRRAYKGTHVRAGPDGDPRDEITRYATYVNAHAPRPRSANKGTISCRLFEPSVSLL